MNRSVRIVLAIALFAVASSSVDASYVPPTATTAAGTSATTALPVQGVTGGVPAPVTDSAGSNFAAVVSAITAAALTPPLAIKGNTSTDGSTTITTGGTAQNLFSGATPAHGYEICNPNTSDDLWVSDSTTAAANGTGSVRVAANGGCYATPLARLPIQAVSVVAATTGDKITARSY